MDGKSKPALIPRITGWAMRQWEYCSAGVWSDNRPLLRIKLIKTVNLSIRSFLDTNVQSTACAMTYRTLLAIVPALALLFAIGRGFGFQNILTSQLFDFFPAQQKALETAFRFVDSYLAQASEGLFLGVGIVFLLYTLISLVSSIEDAFNSIWGVRRGRSYWRKITDYTAIFLILPILMICSSGLTIFMSSTLQSAISIPVISPALSVLLDFASMALTWMFFTGIYMLIPNTKVKFRNALPSGILAGIAFQVLQWLFVSGQLYVSKYNAIYGGFAFLPLLLIWLQLVWVITLAGATVSYSAQNIFRFAYDSEVDRISLAYRRKVMVSVMTVIAQRFYRGEKPLRQSDFVRYYGLPPKLMSDIVDNLIITGLITATMPEHEDDEPSLQPASDVGRLTVGDIIGARQHDGVTDFLPHFTEAFQSVCRIVDHATEAMIADGNSIRLIDIPIDTELQQTNSK